MQLFDTNELRSITNLNFDTSRDFFQLNLSLDIAEAQALEKRTVLQEESKELLVQLLALARCFIVFTDRLKLW